MESDILDDQKSDNSSQNDNNYCKDKNIEIVFNRYVRRAYEADESINSATRETANKIHEELTAKVNRFLQRHARMDYEGFVKVVDPYEFSTEAYAKLPSKHLRKRLFDYRAYVYLIALEDCESEGADISQLLDRILFEQIPFIKKIEREPTFDAIYKICKKK